MAFNSLWDNGRKQTSHVAVVLSLLHLVLVVLHVVRETKRYDLTSSILMTMTQMRTVATLKLLKRSGIGLKAHSIRHVLSLSRLLFYGAVTSLLKTVV